MIHRDMKATISQNLPNLNTKISLPEMLATQLHSLSTKEKHGIFTKLFSTTWQQLWISCANLSALASMPFTAGVESLTQPNKMASRSSSQISSTQPRLHGACILPGHILVNERFHGSEIVKALKGLCCSFVYKLPCLTRMVGAKFAPKFK